MANENQNDELSKKTTEEKQNRIGEMLDKLFAEIKPRIELFEAELESISDSDESLSSGFHFIFGAGSADDDFLMIRGCSAGYDELLVQLAENAKKSALSAFIRNMMKDAFAENKVSVNGEGGNA